MRMSRNKARARLAARAGLMTGVVGAALLVAPQAALAANVVKPLIADVGSKVTITDVDTDPFTANTSKVLLSTGTTCPAYPSAFSTTILDTVTTGSNTTEVVEFTVPSGTAGLNGQAKKYLACVYPTTTPAVAATTSAPVYVSALPTANPAFGATGGGNEVTVTAASDSAAVFTNVTTVGAVFTSSTCPTAYGTPAATMTTPVTKVSNSEVTLTVPSGVTTVTAPTDYSICFYNGVGSTSAVISRAAYRVSLVSLSQVIGPWGGGNGVNITSPASFLAGVTQPGVVFEPAASTCPVNYVITSTPGTQVTAPSASVRRLSDNRMALTVPALLGLAPANDAEASWKMCIYSGESVGSSTVIASTSYKVTIVPAATGVTPKAGPALGKSRITVTGTNFPIESGKITATLGGAPLTEITPITSTAFTAITPMHAPASNVTLVVTTESGSSQLNNAYTYTSALVVSPNTAPNTRPVDVIINGVGFQSASFNPDPASFTNGAHIYLVKGVYSGSENGAQRANPPVADCGNVLVLSDTEAICNLPLTRRLNLAGTALATVSAPAAPAVSIDTVAGSRVITGTGLDAEDVGLVIYEASPTGFTVGTTIVDVLSATKAVVSNTALATGTQTVALYPALDRSITVTTVNTNASVTVTSGTVSAADIGKYVIAPGVPVGTKIGTVPTSTSFTLVQADGTTPEPATASATVAADIHLTTVPVPQGAYNLTYVSNGTLGAVGTDPTYVQSLISSPSTFTVAPF
jgi:hypothetical protein